MTELVVSACLEGGGDSLEAGQAVKGERKVDNGENDGSIFAERQEEVLKVWVFKEWIQIIFLSSPEQLIQVVVLPDSTHV